MAKEGEKLLPTACVPHFLKKCGLGCEGGRALMTSSSGPGSKFGHHPSQMQMSMTGSLWEKKGVDFETGC